jgi:ribosomal protein S18 acetylase RimI-like enzyme
VQPQVRVRPAVQADVPAIFAMKRDLARAEGNEAVLSATEGDWLRDGFGPGAQFRCVVAERGGVALGMVTYSEVYMTALAGTVFSIQDLYVAPPARKLGVGRALVAEIARLAVAQGIPLIQLMVHQDSAARRFYRRLGFGYLRECLTYAIGGPPMLELTVAARETPALPR